MGKHKNLPQRYLMRADVPYVIRGYTADQMPTLGDDICARLAVGESLRSICKRERMPSMSTVFEWLRLDPAFAQNYTRAREHQAESYADEIASIADSAQGLDSAGVNAARLRVDARKWCASKLLPKRYGDRIDVQHQGGISVAAASKALATVAPITFDEEGNEIDAEEGTLVAVSTEPAEVSAGTKLAGVSANGGGEASGSKHRAIDGPPHPLPPPPGKGTPITVTACDTPQAQNPKIPSEIRHSSVESPTLSDLL